MRRLQLFTEPLPENFSIVHAAATIADRPFTIFLDSSDANSHRNRYSILVTEPIEKVETDWPRLKDLLQPSEVNRKESWPFCGGWIGYLAYEAYRHTIPKVTARKTRYPEVGLGFYDTFIITDHGANESYIASLGLQNVESDSNRSLAEQKMATLNELIQKNPPQSPFFDRRKSLWDKGGPGGISSLTSREKYHQDITKIQEYIAAGDCYQVNYTQCFWGKTERPPFELYQSLRTVSPSSYAAFINWGEFQILSSSPESFLEINGETVQTRPIKGTRPRGTTPAEDQRLRKELLESDKDRAELLMITDLERNDLGKVCRPGSVATESLVEILELPHLYHLYSFVTGKLAADKSAWDVLNACFPGGSITGAPKIRAMQIINQLESHPREVYTGAIGFISIDGAMNMNIAIRTMICESGRINLYTGGGIVADSDPEAEYEECLLKMRGMQAALET